MGHQESPYLISLDLMKHSCLPPHSSSWNMDGASFHLFIFTWVLGMLPSLHMPFLYFTLWWRREGDIFEIYFPASKFISSIKPWYILSFKVNISIFLVCSCIAWQVLSCIAIIIIIWCVFLSWPKFISYSPPFRCGIQCWAHICCSGLCSHWIVELNSPSVLWVGIFCE